MHNALLRFPWPILPGEHSQPQWDGRRFLVGRERVDVLRYESARSNWNSDLTQLHEAEAGTNHPIDRASRALAIKSIRDFVSRQNGIVLDVGCSSGFFVEALRREEPDLPLIGSDFIEPPLRALAARLPEVPLLQFDLRKCPLPDACLDAVVALNVLEHIEQDETALRHIWRILRPGGIAHIEVPAGPQLYDIYDEFLMHCRRYTLSQLLDLARRAGFEKIRATHLGSWIYPAFAYVKQKNRRLLDRSPEEKKRIVARQIRGTSHSPLLALLLRGELFFGKWLTYPRGIRCVAVLRKPPAA